MNPAQLLGRKRSDRAAIRRADFPLLAAGSIRDSGGGHRLPADER
jgi:hypothetical protein